MLKNDNLSQFKALKQNQNSNIILKRNLTVSSPTLDCCPNCGNTKPVFYHFQSGMLVCFICRKASFENQKEVSAY